MPINSHRTLFIPSRKPPIIHHPNPPPITSTAKPVYVSHSNWAQPPNRTPSQKNDEMEKKSPSISRLGHNHAARNRRAQHRARDRAARANLWTRVSNRYNVSQIAIDLEARGSALSFDSARYTAEIQVSQPPNLLPLPPLPSLAAGFFYKGGTHHSARASILILLIFRAGASERAPLNVGGV